MEVVRATKHVAVTKSFQMMDVDTSTIISGLYRLQPDSEIVESAVVRQTSGTEVVARREMAVRASAKSTVELVGKSQEYIYFDLISQLVPFAIRFFSSSSTLVLFLLSNAQDLHDPGEASSVGITPGPSDHVFEYLKVIVGSIFFPARCMTFKFANLLLVLHPAAVRRRLLSHRKVCKKKFPL